MNLDTLLPSADESMTLAMMEVEIQHGSLPAWLNDQWTQDIWRLCCVHVPVGSKMPGRRLTCDHTYPSALLHPPSHPDSHHPPLRGTRQASLTTTHLMPGCRHGGRSCNLPLQSLTIQYCFSLTSVFPTPVLFFGVFIFLISILNTVMRALIFLLEPPHSLASQPLNQPPSPSMCLPSQLPRDSRCCALFS